MPAVSFKLSVHWLLIAMPVSAVLDAMGTAAPLVFFSAAVAILPLAILIVHSTEHLAAHTGPALGGLLNATCGNLPELIIAAVALRAGLLEMVRASLIGALLANLLLALGLAFFLGGLRHRTQEYNPAAARILRVDHAAGGLSMVVPSTFHRFLGGEAPRHAQALDAGVALVLLAAYALYLVFMLRTHPEVFAGTKAEEAEHGAAWSVRRGRRYPPGGLARRGLDERDPRGRGRSHRTRPRDVADVHRHRAPRRRRRRRRERGGDRHGPQESDGPLGGNRHGKLHPDRALRHAGAGAVERA